MIKDLMKLRKFENYGEEELEEVENLAKKGRELGDSSFSILYKDYSGQVKILSGVWWIQRQKVFEDQFCETWCLKDILYYIPTFELLDLLLNTKEDTK